MKIEDLLQSLSRKSGNTEQKEEVVVDTGNLDKELTKIEDDLEVYSSEFSRLPQRVEEKVPYCSRQWDGQVSGKVKDVLDHVAFNMLQDLEELDRMSEGEREAYATRHTNAGMQVERYKILTEIHFSRNMLETVKQTFKDYAPMLILLVDYKLRTDKDEVYMCTERWLDLFISHVTIEVVHSKEYFISQATSVFELLSKDVLNDSIGGRLNNTIFDKKQEALSQAGEGKSYDNLMDTILGVQRKAEALMQEREDGKYFITVRLFLRILRKMEKLQEQ